MTDPIQFGANPPQIPSRNTADDTDVRVEYSSKARYSYAESTVVSLQTGAAPRPVQEASKTQSLSPEQAANNILQFIAQRLASLKASGASSTSLEAAFGEAKKGFAQGLEQALGVLRGNGALDDVQSERLERLENRFKQGIETIAANLFGSQNIEDEVASLTQQQATAALGGTQETSAAPIQAAAISDAPAPLAKESVAVQFRATESFAIKQKTSQIAASRDNANLEAQGKDDFARSFIDSYQSTRASFKRKESVDLQLRTQDGDIVTLSFNAKHSGKFRSESKYGIAQLGSETGLQANSREFAKLFGKSELNISVVGELDDAEYAALQDIFNQLGGVFSAFFSGDNQGALEQALSLNIDSSEIATLTVDLQLKQEQKLVQKYREIASIGTSEAQSNGGGLTLADYLEQIRDIAMTKTKITDKSLIEQLLSISFAAGDLEIDEDGEPLTASQISDDSSDDVQSIVADSPEALTGEALAELL